ncbi:sensor histidine kinase [Krasilnikovia cinnamomea]|uniref:sensor histidine kinase n=1 Tax=Krasilnikovia cinnamomea TaxID=349313 RepID=UPI00102B9C0F|nr:ATP-binding protein [Krasilnikovia cinnamomea]
MQARERLLRERSAQAERLESLGRLAGGVAHDFNNLLAVILSAAELASDPAAREAEVRADLARVLGAADSARQLCRQLLLFARGESVDVEAVDLNAVLVSVRDLLAYVVGEHVRLVTRPAATPLLIEAERSRLEQVLVNLVVNARDAMPDGGTVEIEASTARVEDDPAFPDVRPGWHALLVVRDTGAGMTNEVAEHIFEPFFTTKAKDKGTGLGLATVYGIVKEFGGGISVESELGVGTTFRMLLPCAQRGDLVAAR